MGILSRIVFLAQLLLPAAFVAQSYAQSPNGVHPSEDRERILSAKCGDGHADDTADWANARLTPGPKAQGTPKRPLQSLEIAPFARVMTCDPNRMEGAHSNRLEEFPAEDVFL